MEHNLSVTDVQVLLPAPGAKIYKLAENRWQVVTPTGAMTMNCPEELLSGVVAAFGVHDANHVVGQLDGRFTSEVIHGFLDALKAKNIVHSGDPAHAPAVRDRLFQLFPRSPEHNAAFAPEDFTLRVVGTGCTYDAVCRMARESGFRLSDDSSAAVDMLLVIGDTPQHDRFRAVNREQVVAAGVPAIFAHLDGAVARLFRVVPGATACFECLHHRMRVAKTFTQEFDAASSGNAVWFEDPLPLPTLQAQQLAATTLMQAALMLAHGVHDLHENYLIELFAFNEMKRKSPVLKLPRCSVCSSANNDQPMPPIYNPAS